MNIFRAMLCLACFFIFTNAYALKTKDDQLIALDAIIAELKTHYGMIKFKNKMFGTDLDELAAKYEELIDQGKTLEEDLGWDPPSDRKVLPPEEFRQLMVGMIAELRDGHVNISRQTNESATLGVIAVSVGEKLIVTMIRKDLIVPYSSMKDIQPGDEIIEVDGVPVNEHAKRNLIYMSGGTFSDRYQTAMLTIVNNFHAFQRPKREGDTAILKLRRDGKEFTARLRWVYRHDYNMLLARFPKEVRDPLQKMNVEEVAVPYGVRGTVRSYFKTGLLKTDAADSLVDIGATLNVEITRTKEESSKPQHEANSAMIRPELKRLSPVSRLQFYMVRHGGKNIGVLRIPSYNPPDGMAGVKAEYQWLAQALKKAEKMVDVLVIDQLSNTGGYVYYGSRLLSLFASGDQPMQTVLADYKLNITMLNLIKPHFEGDPIDETSRVYAEMRLHERHYNELKRRFENGEEWTGLGPSFELSLPQFAEKPGEVFAAKEGVFTKPILLLNDRMSGSGGDFFPAQMQNNKRAIVMGDTSCGLGGPVYRNTASMPGSEMSFRCTYGYAELPDGWPIENVGVVPDHYREVRISDLKDDFRSYASEVLNAAVGLIDPPKPMEPTQTSTALMKTDGPEMIEIPEVLKEDIILRTLWERLEVVARLREMRALPRWRGDKASLKVIDELIEKGERAPEGTRFADPCELRLLMKPLK